VPSRIGAAIVKAAPVTVRVTADFAARWPLELAHVAGVPLAARGDVSLVYAPAGQPGPPKAEITGTLRVLAVFSQPTKTSVLALRRERYALSRLTGGSPRRSGGCWSSRSSSTG
jgi:hypothetical protein